MQPRWYRNAVVYVVDPAMFRDSDGDGWGDLRGITDRLDHIRGLGATCLWILPFYASPYRDGGYDITDHLAVDPRFGDVADFALLLDKADELGLRVLVDLVGQHTSIEHRWFEEARRDRNSPYRDYYVWADEPHETDVSPNFPTVEDSVWTWDDEAQQFYRHVFYSHEPDLELGNPRVREELERVMAFWMRMGVAGFRVDAVPYMVERARAADPRHDGHWLLHEMRDFVARRGSEAVLLGEVDVSVEKYADYFAGGKGLTMLLDFWLNNHLFLSFARADATPLADAIAKQPAPPEWGQYANWLRNHDELDLEQLSDDERAEVFEVFAPDESMRAYGRGIRRRLGPMLGTQRRIALAHAVLHSLPGTPIILYGDELGMGDDLDRPQRLSVRTPMQWSDEPNAGFSAAPADQLITRVIDDGPFAYDRVNAYHQTLRRDSLQATLSNMVRTRTGLREIGLGRCRVLDVQCRPVLALRYDHEDTTLVMLANLADERVDFSLPDDDLGDLVDILADSDYDAVESGSGRIEVEGYGYRWLRPRERLFA